MDPDAEFNLLTTLYQSVVHDMKHTYPGWESLSQKAMKLGTQLKQTAQCLAAFVEAMQGVCDHANNLKGASRDVGACVTRVCIKQRAIENRMRSWADALCDELAISLQQRGNYWKTRCQELDKQAGKHVKKIRSRKQRPDITAMNEQRDICTKVLTEQRTQFAFFIGTLMPVLNAQMNMLDEGAHLRQVVDNLESTVKHVDTEQLVSSIVTDISQGPDSAWKQCLAQAGQKWRSSEDGYSCVGSVRDLSTRATTPASNFSSEDGMGTLTTNGALSGSRSISTSCARNLPLLTNGTTMESSASSVISSSTRFSSSTKPPLQRRNSEKSIGQFSMSSPNTDGSSNYLNLMGNGAGNSSSNTITEMTQYQNGLQHPIHHHQVVGRSSSVNMSNGHHTCAPPAYQQVINQRQHLIGNQNMTRPNNLNFDTYSMSSSCIGATPTIYQATTPAGSSSAASTSALLITEACKEIDQLGSDLENYCALTSQEQQTRYFVHDSEKARSTTGNQMMSNGVVNRRSSHAAGEFTNNVQVLDPSKRASVTTLGNCNMSNYSTNQGQPHQNGTNGGGGVRMRTTSASRPPPPARRSSQITAATPTAPSVAEQRMNGSMGSRQSLDSAGLYDSGFGSMGHPQQHHPGHSNHPNQQQYFQMSSFSKPPTAQPAAQSAAAKFRI